VPGQLLRELGQRAATPEAAPLGDDHLSLVRALALASSLPSAPAAPSDWLQSLGEGAKSSSSSSGGVARRSGRAAAGGQRLHDRTGKSRSANGPEHERWLSDLLIQMRVPHQSPFVVAGMYHLPVAFPQASLLLEVVGPIDTASPSQRPLGSTVLRRRQLTAMGWRCEELASHAVQKAVMNGTLQDLLLPVLASSGLATSQGSAPQDASATRAPSPGRGSA